MKNVYTLIFCILGLNVSGQNKITGQIIDAVSEKPIYAAFIVKVGHGSKPILTDKHGKFKLSGMEKDDTLMFSATGYTPTMTEVGNAKKIKVLLNPEKKENSVEIGYGSQDAKSLTSSVVVLEAKDLNKVLAPDIYSYLRGKVPGLQVEAYGYNPAVAPRIMLRGAGSFSATYEPLIVIDGVQGASLINLDPNDVKSVTVLKDASAQAIYGSRAAGGVIIIKTKGGKA
jgi:TonB-dependent SusC/RagA subfamily outer membrane receptor